MCAIAGIIGLEVNDKTVSRILGTMQRRGPDATGAEQGTWGALLHARLAVIDLRGGKQPMSLEFQGERYTLVYNGELYNTRELRRQLQSLGHRFQGHSDTEVVLHAYARWGEGCLERFNGIFAFAVLEENSRKVFLARDRIGVKPLFYKLHQGGLVFASEIKSILAYPGVKAELDEEGAAELLLLGPGRSPGSGVFRDIRELEPGCCGCYSCGKLTLRRYWYLRDREHRESFDETAECVRYLVEDAIRRQTVSDVPIGTFLSGGLDSSLITAVCARQLGEGLRTFSVDYRDNDRFFVPGKFQPNSDNHYIRLMERHLGTDHRWTVLGPEELLEALEDATVARDLPGMADVDFSLLAFCRRIREDVTVALSGECADEIFGGYPWYRDPEVRAVDGFPWAQNTVQRCALLHPALSGKLDAPGFIRERYLQTLRESDILPENPPEERRMKEMVNLNFRWFMQTLLDRKDRMSMYWGLEVRVPFCDWRIAEYLYAVPWAYKDHGGFEKGLLRHAMAGWLPEEVLWRKKSPYPKTFDPRYTEMVCGRLRELLREDAPLFSLVSRQAVEKLMEGEQPWPWYGQLMKMPQTVAWLLQLDFWLRHYRVELTF